ncbi:MAG: metallophosphoesterase [Candidatus Acetothermia bacterium]
MFGKKKDKYLSCKRLLVSFSVLFLLALVLIPPPGPRAAEEDVTWGPYLTLRSASELVVNWKGTGSGAGELYYRRAIRYWQEEGFSENTLSGPESDGFHHVGVSGLDPATRYVYAVDGKTGPGRENYFTSLRDEPDGFSFFAYSDTQNCYQRHRIVASEMALDPADPAFVLHAGDLVESPLSENWKNFFWAIRPYSGSTPLLPVLGNHEKNHDSYYDAFVLPEGGGDYGKEWYSFTYGDARFIFLDSNAGQIGLGDFLKQTNWLKDQLERNEKPFTVVVFHHPIFSSKYPEGADVGLKDSWHRIFKEGGVDLVFSGHIHSYERSVEDGITYIVTGGGGAPTGNLESRFDFSRVAISHTLHYIRVNLDGGQATVQAVKVADLEEGYWNRYCDDEVVVKGEVMDEVTIPYKSE